MEQCLGQPCYCDLRLCGKKKKCSVNILLIYLYQRNLALIKFHICSAVFNTYWYNRNEQCYVAMEKVVLIILHLEWFGFCSYDTYQYTSDTFWSSFSNEMNYELEDLEEEIVQAPVCPTCIMWKKDSMSSHIVSCHGNGFRIAPSYTGRGSYILDVVCDDGPIVFLPVRTKTICFHYETSACI